MERNHNSGPLSFDVTKTKVSENPFLTDSPPPVLTMSIKNVVCKIWDNFACSYRNPDNFFKALGHLFGQFEFPRPLTAVICDCIASKKPAHELRQTTQPPALRLRPPPVKSSRLPILKPSSMNSRYRFTAPHFFKPKWESISPRSCQILRLQPAKTLCPDHRYRSVKLAKTRHTLSASDPQGGLLLVRISNTCSQSKKDSFQFDQESHFGRSPQEKYLGDLNP
jgi:hypothetical protein